MNPNVVRQYDVHRGIIGVTLVAGALLLPTACAADDREAPNPAPSVSQPFETGPTPTEEAESAPTATGTYEEFAAAIDSAPLNNLGSPMTVDGIKLNCDAVVAYRSIHGVTNPSFDPATDYPTCSQGQVTSEIRALSAYFNQIEQFANSDAFPEGTDPDIKAGITMQVGAAIYDQFNGLREGIDGYDQSHEEMIEIVKFLAQYTYDWENGMHTGHELTDQEITDIYYAARNDVYNLGQTPDEIVAAAPALIDPATSESTNVPAPVSALADQLITEAKSTPGDPTTTISFFGGRDTYNCDDLLGARLMEGVQCDEYQLSLFAVTEKHYKEIAAQTGVSEAATAFITFQALRLIEDGITTGYSADDMRNELTDITGVDVGEGAIPTIGNALGASERYPELFTHTY